MASKKELDNETINKNLRLLAMYVYLMTEKNDIKEYEELFSNFYIELNKKYFVNVGDKIDYSTLSPLVNDEIFKEFLEETNNLSNCNIFCDSYINDLKEKASPLLIRDNRQRY